MFRDLGGYARLMDVPQGPDCSERCSHAVSCCMPYREEVVECSGGAFLLSQRGCLVRTVPLEGVAGSFAASLRDLAPQWWHDGSARIIGGGGASQICDQAQVFSRSAVLCCVHVVSLAECTRIYR